MAKSQNSDKRTSKGEKNVETSEIVEDAVSEKKSEGEHPETSVPDAPDTVLKDDPDLPQDSAETSATDRDPDRNDSDPALETPDETAAPEPETPGTAQEETSETAASEQDKDQHSMASQPDDTRDPEPEKDDRDAADPVEDIAAKEIADDRELPEREAEPATQPMPAPQVRTEIVKGSIWPGVFGGVIAALIGFIVGRGDMIDPYLPASMQRPTVDVSAFEAQTAALAAELAAQTSAQAARLDALEAVGVAAVLETVGSLEGDLEGIAARIAALENQPAIAPATPGAPVEAVEELQSALAAQNAQIAALAERAEAAEASAAGEAARILARAALTRVVTAVDSGEGFGPALADLEEVAPVEVPDALRVAAETGVPTLAALQASFPDAARSGLAAARAEVPESEVVGITGFLKRQLNVRSVTPREGDDPDAVLSRAQAAVSGGDLGAALSEMELLPEVARAAMNDWLEAAAARKAAQDAANALSDSLNSN